MSWQLRLCGENLFHHIYAWGNNRNLTFQSCKHFEYYLKLLTLYSDKYQIDIIAYALMDWHVHLFIHDKINAMADFMQDLHGTYARYYNYEVNRVGHVFGERYNNVIVQPTRYALSLSRYIHRQAVEAGLVINPKSYKWTSFQRYIGSEPRDFVKPDIILDHFGDKSAPDKRSMQYIQYILGNKPDSVDWDRRDFNVVGDDSFCGEIKRMNRDNKRVRVIPNDLVLIASIHLDVDRERIMHPHSLVDRKLRHRAFLYLVDEYDCSYNEVARSFKVARLTVLKAIAKQKNGL